MEMRGRILDGPFMLQILSCQNLEAYELNKWYLICTPQSMNDF